MADSVPKTRPLSPHLQIYRPQMNSVMSIFHRFTGVGMGLTAILVVWWFLAAATSDSAFALIDGLLTSWLGILVMGVSLLAFWYHLLNGVRHLRWDSGHGYGITASRQSGIRVLVLALVLSALSIYLIF